MAVEFYAGSRYPERPRAVFWEGRWLEVVEVEARWRTPRGLGFRIRASDGRRFVLTYWEGSDTWHIAEVEGPSLPHRPSLG